MTFCNMLQYIYGFILVVARIVCFAWCTGLASGSNKLTVIEILFRYISVAIINIRNSFFFVKIITNMCLEFCDYFILKHATKMINKILTNCIIHLKLAPVLLGSGGSRHSQLLFDIYVIISLLFKEGRPVSPLWER